MIRLLPTDYGCEGQQLTISKQKLRFLKMVGYF